MAGFNSKRKSYLLGGSLALLALFLGCCAWPRSQAQTSSTTLFALQEDPVPTVDHLAIPELPENPTQVDIGRNSYFYNCMPCHGDRGQGLTDEFRETWVEDHQNCWARGCHSGRAGEEGFPIPTVVPAVAVEPGALQSFTSSTALHNYLEETHPPQQPGILPEEDYWALTAFLLSENGRLAPGPDLGPTITPPTAESTATTMPTITPPATASPTTTPPAATTTPTAAAPAAAPAMFIPNWALPLAFALLTGVFVLWIWRKQHGR